MSGSKWVITPSWLSGSWRSFLYSSSGYFYHLFFISSASVRSMPFLSFIEPIFAWNVPLITLEFNSDEHYIYYCGQESLRRNGVAIIVNKTVQNVVLGCNLKNDRIISVCFQSKPFNITIIQAPTSNAEEAEAERFYEDLQNLLELTPQKDVLFIIGNWNAKVGRQETPGITGKFGLGVQNQAGQRLIVLPREHIGHSKHPLPTTQEKTLHMDITRWSIPKSDWLYSLHPKMEKLYTVSKNETRSWLWLRSWTPYC